MRGGDTRGSYIRTTSVLDDNVMMHIEIRLVDIISLSRASMIYVRTH